MLDTIAYVVGWTLVHSLWQGAAIAVVAGLLLAAVPRGSARVRYAILCVALFAHLAAPIVTAAVLAPGATSASRSPFFTTLLAPPANASPVVSGHTLASACDRWGCRWHDGHHDREPSVAIRRCFARRRRRTRPPDRRRGVDARRPRERAPAHWRMVLASSARGTRHTRRGRHHQSCQLAGSCVRHPAACRGSRLRRRHRAVHEWVAAAGDRPAAHDALGARPRARRMRS